MAPLTVLHVDDDPDFADLVATFLEREREALSVVTETDPRDARERFAAAPDEIDCVVSDYDMPGTDGLELLDELREIDPEIPFVLFTGHGNEKIASEAISTGVTDYLRKGTGTDQYAVLANRVVNAVSKRRTERELEHRTEQAQKTFEFSRDALFVFDPADETIRECNSAACTMLGYSREELLDLSPEAVQPTQMDEFHSFIDRVLETGEGWTDEFTGLTSDGRRVASEISASRIDLDGRPHVLASVRDITDRKERERERERSEALLEKTQRMANVGGWELDLATNELRWTDGTGRIHDLPSDYEPTLDEAFEFYHPEDRPVMKAAVERAIAEGECYDLECRLHTASGDRRWVRSIGEPSCESGETSVLRGVIQDITERKERERELERQRELFEKTFKHSSDALFLLDPATETIVESNTTACVMLGYSREDLLALSPEAIHPGEIDRLRSFIESVLETGEGWTDEFTCLTSDGQRLSAEISASRIDLGGRPHVLASVRDVTERKERERELETYVSMVNSVPDLVYRLDADGRFVAVNDAAESITGYRPEELYGEHVSIVMDDADVAVGEEAIRDLLGDDTRERATFEMDLLTADGERVPFENHISLVRSQAGTFRGTVGIVRDITARKERERALRSTTDTLTTLLANVPGHVLAVNGSNEVLFANDELRELFDLTASAESLVGTDYGTIVERASDRFTDSDRFVESSTAAVAAGRSVSGEEFELLDGRTIERSGTSIPVEDGADRYLWVYLDVTPRKRTERTLQALHEGTREMMNAETPTDVCDIAVETAHDALNLPLTGCWLYDPDAVCLRPTAFTDEAHAMFDEFPTYTAGNSLSWEVFVTGEPAVYDDIDDRPGTYNPESPIASEIVVPIGDYGVLNSGSTEPGQFDASDVSVARILAANTEAALKRAEREALLRDRETQIERERDRLAALFENVPDPMYRYRRENGTVVPEAVNPAFERVFGYDEARVVGQPITETIVPADRVEEHEALMSAADEDDSLDAEVERLTATGRGTFLVRNAPIDASIDDRTAGYAIYTDITERQEADAYRRQLYDIVSDAELTTDERVRELLDLGCERLGLEAAFLTRIEGDTARVTESVSSYDGIESGTEHPLSEVYCRRAIASDDPITVIEHAGASDWADDPAYERLGVETYVGSQLTVNDDLYGTVCFVDRTPRETDFSTVELGFVDLLTRGIASELERRRYERELERQNERLEQFAGVLSHDLRNPLGIAAGYLDLLPAEGNEEVFEKVRNAHRRMERIIEDVLALTRQGKTVVESGRVALVSVAETAWAHVETGRARLVTTDDLGHVEADRSRLETLFENLFRNAITHAGEDALVRVERTPTGFAVSDDGPGIEPAEREQVFEYGHTTGSGTGLGLSIVRTVADAHGWRVTVSASDLGGARFEISIPDAASR